MFLILRHKIAVILMQKPLNLLKFRHISASIHVGFRHRVV